MKAEVICVSCDALVGEVARIKVEGYRFVTLSCAETDGNSVNILYHFDRNLALKHIRLSALKDTPIPSISPVYFAAFLVENEIQDLFGITFKGLVVDYKRTLYLEEEVRRTPFYTYTAVQTPTAAKTANPGPVET